MMALPRVDDGGYKSVFPKSWSIVTRTRSSAIAAASTVLVIAARQSLSVHSLVIQPRSVKTRGTFGPKFSSSLNFMR